MPKKEVEDQTTFETPGIHEQVPYTTDADDDTPDETEAAGTDAHGEADPQPAAEDTPPDTETPPQEAYEPDFSYKVYDDTKEFPEQFRPLVTDKESEEFVRSYLCKADGLDGLKPRHEKTVAERDELKAKYTELESGVERLREFAKTDLDMLHEMFDVKEEDLINHVSKKLHLQEATPEERAEHDAALKVRRENYELDHKYKNLEQQNQQLQATQHELALNQALSTPDVHDFQKTFDGTKGSGAFKQKVVEYGAAHYYRTGEDISATEAVAAVYDEFKSYFNQATEQPAAQAQAPAQPTPTIPNVGTGGGAAPARPVYRSIEDLKQRARELNGG